MIQPLLHVSAPQLSDLAMPPRIRAGYRNIVCRTPVLVPQLGIRSGLQKADQVWELPRLRRIHESRGSFGIPQVDAGSVPQQQLQRLVRLICSLVNGAVHEWRHPVGIGRIHLGAVVERDGHNIQGRRFAGPLQRSFTVLFCPGLPGSAPLAIKRTTELRSSFYAVLNGRH